MTFRVDRIVSQVWNETNEEGHVVWLLPVSESGDVYSGITIWRKGKPDDQYVPGAELLLAPIKTEVITAAEKPRLNGLFAGFTRVESPDPENPYG